MILPLDLSQWQNAGVDLGVVDVEDTLLAAEDARNERRHKGPIHSLERTSDVIVAAMEMHSFDSHVQLSLMNMKQHRQEADMVTAAAENREYICAKRHAKSMMKNMERGQSDWCQLPASCHVPKAEVPGRDVTPPSPSPRPIEVAPVVQDPPPPSPPPRSPGGSHARRSSTDGARAREPFRPVGYSASRVMTHSAAQSNIAALRRVYTPPTPTTSNINKVSLGLDLPPSRQARSSLHTARASAGLTQQRLNHSQRVSEQHVAQHNLSGGGLTVTPMALAGSGGSAPVMVSPNRTSPVATRARRRSTASNFGSLSGDALEEGISSRSRTPEHAELVGHEDGAVQAAERPDLAAANAACDIGAFQHSQAPGLRSHSADEMTSPASSSAASSSQLLAAARASATAMGALGVGSAQGTAAAAFKPHPVTMSAPELGGFTAMLAAQQATAMALNHSSIAGTTFSPPAAAAAATVSHLLPTAASTPASVADEPETASTPINASSLSDLPPPPGTAWRNLRLGRSRANAALPAAPPISSSSTLTSPHSLASSATVSPTARQLWDRPEASGSELFDNGGPSTSTNSDFVAQSSGPLRPDRAHTPSSRSMLSGRPSSTALVASRLQGTASSRSLLRHSGGSRLHALSAGGFDRRHSYNGGLDLIRNGLNSGNGVFGQR